MAFLAERHVLDRLCPMNDFVRCMLVRAANHFTSRLHGHCVDTSALRAEADVNGGKADVEIEGLLSARERTFSRQAQKVRS